MDLNLKGKRALVCGSSQGIGRASARELAELGASITLVARSREKLEKGVEELKEICPEGHHDFLVADFTSPEKTEGIVAQYGEDSPFQILINNAGGPPPGPLTEAKVEEFDRALKMHLFTSHLLVKNAIGYMKDAGYGRIINIISTSVRQPIPNLGVSNTIRGAMASWAKTLSGELGPLGITVNNILPGFTETQRLESLLRNRAEKQGMDYEELIKKLEKQVPLGRFAQPREIAAAVAFLASPAGGYVSGQSLAVDGGRTKCI